jgi:hypothetical protein
MPTDSLHFFALEAARELLPASMKERAPGVFLDAMG